MRQVLPAGLGGDGESRRDRQAQLGHLGEVRALAAEQILLILVALGEVENVLRHWSSSLVSWLGLSAAPQAPAEASRYAVPVG